MTWFFAVLIVLALGGIALVASGSGTPMAPVDTDRPVVAQSDGEITGGDLRRVRFPLALRGYRMADVDVLLARLATQLEQSPTAEDGAEDGGGPDF